MDYVELGATGLRVSVAGFGTGGNSRLGIGVGKSEDEAIALVHAALDLGVNFFDTAEAYGTEPVLGAAFKSVPRDRFVISSKSRIVADDDRLLSGAEVVANLDASLRRLGLDHIDVFHPHAVPPHHYAHVRDEIAPALLREKEKGKIGHLGITATPPRDPDQVMLLRALDDHMWEVFMLAFHMMNHGPRRTIFPRTRKQNVGTLLMFVVRNIFSRPGVLRTAMQERAAKGEIPQALADDPDPLGFLVHAGGAASLTDAAYRFARHEPGAHVILFGTSDQGHLRANVDSILKPPLPKADTDKLAALFGHLSGVGLVFPDKPRVPMNPSA